MNVQILVSDQVVHRIGWCLVHFVWQGLLVALGLAVILGLLRNRAANARYLVCFGALLLMAALPVLTYGVQGGFVARGAAANPSPVPAGTGDAVSAPSVSRGLAMMVNGSVKAHASDLIEMVLPWLCVAWICGVIALALQNIAAWFYVRGLVRRETVALDVSWTRLAEGLRLSLRIRRPVRLLESARAAAPMAAGILKPVVLLPAAVMTGLTPGQVEAILAHELAHIRRHDFLANLVQIAIETFLFYHPAVWWVSRRVREERENCCDDLAVRTCGSTIRYARALTTLAELVTAPSALALGATEGLFRRVQRIVGLPEKRSFGSAPVLAGLFVILVLFGSMIGGRYVSADVDLTPNVAALNIDTATRDDVIRVFGPPTKYVWDSGSFDEANLPENYIINFPNSVDVWMRNNAVVELRFYRPNYTFRGGIHVGSTVDEVVNALGQPTQVVEGQPNGFYKGVLYKDIDGRKGNCYYAREDYAVRMFFSDDSWVPSWIRSNISWFQGSNPKVCALYVTRSDYTDGGRPPKMPGAPTVDLTPVVEKLNIDTATRDDLIRAFGDPTEYAGDKGRNLDVNNLPSSYVIIFPNDVSAYVQNNIILELRFSEPNYTFRGKIRVGSTLDEVLNALGQPTQTVEGQPLGFYDKVLYKDINGRKGYCYYAREDCAVRIWFDDYKVNGLYVTRSDYSDGGRPPKAPGGSDVDLTPNVATLNIDTATTDDLVRAFGNPMKYVWAGLRLDANKLPATYIIVFPGVDVWMQNNSIQELRFYESNYTFREKIHVGSTVDEVVNALGPPTQTVEGQPNESHTGVLYKDIDGRKGFCYYAREDCAVRIFFKDYKVNGLHVTRSSFSGSR